LISHIYFRLSIEWLVGLAFGNVGPQSKGGRKLVIHQERIMASVNVNHVDFKATTCFINSLKQLTLNKKVLFACIGTDRATGDCLGPLVGDSLKRLGYHVVGTLEEPLHAQNLITCLELKQQELKPDLVVAIDAGLGYVKNIGMITLEQRPIKPGTGVKKDLPLIGDISIMGIVNVAGLLDLQVIQYTRLYIVMKMANTISSLIWRSIPLSKRQEYTVPLAPKLSEKA